MAWRRRGRGGSRAAQAGKARRRNSQRSAWRPGCPRSRRWSPALRRPRQTTAIAAPRSARRKAGPRRARCSVPGYGPELLTGRLVSGGEREQRRQHDLRGVRPTHRLPANRSRSSSVHELHSRRRRVGCASRGKTIFGLTPESEAATKLTSGCEPKDGACARRG